MNVRADPALRCVRAALFALVCTGLAVCGHVLAGGPEPAPVYVYTGFGAMFLTGFGLLGRERGFGLIAGTLLAGEAGLHTLFVIGVHSSAGHHAGMSAMLGLGGWMAAAHVVAACATAGYLRFGESRLWGLIRLAVHRVSWRALLWWLVSSRDAVRVVPPVRPAVPARPLRVRVRAWLVARVVSWRGPPFAPVV